jgi:purine nucleoside phosphorylase
MSSVPEAIVARQCGLNVAALSCITNLARHRRRADLAQGRIGTGQTDENFGSEIAEQRWKVLFAGAENDGF